MKAFLVILALMAPVFGYLVCYPNDRPPCAPNDRSCLPCTNPQTTDPSCAPWITDARKPDAGGDR